MESLAVKRLEARLQVRFAEKALAKCKDSYAKKVAQEQVDSATEYLEILEEEAKKIDAELSEQAANFTVLEHMSRSIQTLNEQSDDNMGRMAENRIHQLLMPRE